MLVGHFWVGTAVDGIRGHMVSVSVILLKKPDKSKQPSKPDLASRVANVLKQTFSIDL